MNITKYKQASFSELLSIAYPLMLTALSGNLMVFMDRLLLCRYVPAAMAAATVVGMIFTIFQFTSISIASIAEVFVGKYNGANEVKKIGPLVWQMIWFSCLTSLIFFPVGFLCGKYFLPESYYAYGIPYFKTLMFFGPLFPLVAALSAFFVGQGKVKLVTLSTVAVNILNVILGYVFIFGLGNIIPAMGTFGAALACGLSILFQAAVLLILFLQKKNKVINSTWNYKFNVLEFWRCIRVGTPNAMGYLIEMTAWAYLLQIMARKDEAHIMILAFGQAIFLLVAFTTDGLQKAIISVSSNIIGAGRRNLLPKVIMSALKLHWLMVMIFSIPLLLFSKEITNLFFASDPSFSQSSSLMVYTKITCVWILVYFIFDGLVWISAGMLTAFEDTFFVMMMNTVSVWLLAILPNYIAITYFKAEPSVIWKLMSIYAFINAIGFGVRYSKFYSQDNRTIISEKNLELS